MPARGFTPLHNSHRASRVPALKAAPFVGRTTDLKLFPPKRKRCGELLLLAAGLLLSPPTELRAQRDTRAIELLRASYRATGAERWNGIAEVKVSGKVSIFGMSGTFSEVIDTQRGRDVQWFAAGPLKIEQANLETSGWLVDQSGISMLQNGPQAKSDAIMQSFIDRNGWFHPRDARPHYDGERKEGGRTFEIISLLPPGGRLLTIWLDKNTHLLDRFAQQDLSQHQLTVKLSDYRRIRGVLYPFRSRQTSDGGGQPIVQAAKHVRFLAAVVESTFTAPHSTISDARLIGHGDSTTVPFELENGRILLDITINGHKPLPFLLDTGALNYLTPAALRSLSLTGSGDVPVNGSGEVVQTAQVATVESVQLGNAQMLHQQFTVGLLPRFLDRGRHTPIAGLVGFELLCRFPISIDYDTKQITLYRPGSAPLPPSGAETFRLSFDGNNPLMDGVVDGNAGAFIIDTGNNGYVTLFHTFYRDHDFPIEVPVIDQMQGGVGGKTRSLVTRVRSLTFGRYSLHQPLISVSLSSTGVLASGFTAGNLGYDFLRNFAITLDYAHTMAYLRASKGYDAPREYNRSGMEFNENEDGQLAIDRLTTDGPAVMAGLKVGDVVLSVNGQTEKLNELLAEPAGTTLTVRYRHGSSERQTLLTLRELLPVNGRFLRPKLQ